MNRVALGQQQFGQVRTILPGDAGDESGKGGGSVQGVLGFREESSGFFKCSGRTNVQCSECYRQKWMLIDS